jgi:hypothetical protein
MCVAAQHLKLHCQHNGSTTYSSDTSRKTYMNEFAKDIYTEPTPVDVNTLANLGPLRAMAGVWEGQRGLDVTGCGSRPPVK